MPVQPKLPYGKQFSPKQVALKPLAALIVAAGGDRAALESAIAKTFHASKADPFTLAMNTFLASRDYGLLSGDSPYTPGALAVELCSLDEAAGHARFAEHILTDLEGLTVIEVVRARAARAEPRTVQGIADDLHQVGVDPGGQRGEKLSALRQWLETGGVLSSGWEIDEAGVKKALGPSVEELDALLALPVEHRAFLGAMTSMSGTPPFDSQAIAEVADAQSATRLKTLRDLPTRILAPLASAGWLTAAKSTSGRGAKAHLVTPSPKFIKDISTPLADALVEQAQLGDPAALRRPLADLLDEVRDAKLSNQVRGHSLEGVSIHLIRALGARFRDWRRRALDTSYAEVDVLADLVNGRYQLIQLQAKVSDISTREIIDREVGIAGRLRSHILIFVSAGKVGPGPRRAADEHMADTNLSILFFDGKDLDALASSAVVLPDLLHREFNHAVGLKATRPAS